VVIVDSPGGQVAGTDLLAEAIKNSSTPIVAFIDGLAASAAYWIISGASKIIASSDLDRIGSIGTMLMAEDLRPALEQLGVKFHEVYATMSVDKNSDINQVLDGKYDQYRENVLDVINAKFLSTVKEYRPDLNDSALTGKIYFSPQAIELGLVDEIGSLEQAIEEAVNLATNQGGLPIEIESKTQETMKMKITWKAIQNFFKMEPAAIESEELTDDRIQQINDQLALVTARNEELEQELASAKEAHSAMLSDLTILQGKDAGSETVAAKDADKFPGSEEGEAIYAHDKIADEFCAKQ
jgi:protease-4